MMTVEKWLSLFENEVGLKSIRSSDERWERDDESYFIDLEVPGFGKEDISIRWIRPRVLDVVAKKGDKVRTYRYRFGEYDGITVEGTVAEVKNGILRIRVMKKEKDGWETRNVIVK